MAPYCAVEVGVVGLTGALNAESHRADHRLFGDLPRRGQHRDHQEHDHPRRTGERPSQDRCALRRARHLPRDRRERGVLNAIASGQMIVPVPRREVLPPVLFYRISPRLPSRSPVTPRSTSHADEQHTDQDGNFGDIQLEIYFRGLEGVRESLPLTFEELEPAPRRSPRGRSPTSRRRGQRAHPARERHRLRAPRA